MKCPKCEGRWMIVDDIVENENDREVYRRRKCHGCGHIFYTVEFEVDVNKRFEEEWAANRYTKK